MRLALEQDGRCRLEARRLWQRRGEGYELGVTLPAGHTSLLEGPVKTPETEVGPLCFFL